MQAAAALVVLGQRAHQCVGVGVPGLGKQGFGTLYFHHLPGIHHRHPLRQVADHAQVVGNEHHRHRQFLLQALQQVENLGLNRHV